MSAASRRLRALACAREIVGAKYDGAIPLPKSLGNHPALTAKPTETYPNPEDVGGWKYVIDGGDWIAFVDVGGKALLWTKRAKDGGVVGAPYTFRRFDLAASRAPRIAFARAVEASADSVAPGAARLWRAGWNKTDKGDLNFTPRSAELVMAAWQARGNPLVWYYEHEDRVPLADRGGCPMRGAASAPSSVLAIREGEGGPECWAEQIQWTEEAKRQIATGERRQLSPIAAYDADTREIIEILNVSLCAEGATHHGTLLASKAGAGKGAMDEIMQKLQDAIDAGDWETAEDLINECERMEGGDAMARMGRYALKCAKMAKAAKSPPAAPPADADDVATKRLAAARFGEVNLLAMLTREMAPTKAALEAATEEAKRAAKESRRATVTTLIAANRDLFDVVDEREHLRAADPEATLRHIASLTRKGGAKILAASRDVDPATGKPKTEAKQPKDEPKRDPAKDLSANDLIAIETFNRGKPEKVRDKATGQMVDNPERMTAEDYIRGRERINTASGGGAN